MNFKKWLLSEMPINQAQLIGRWDKFPKNSKSSDNWDKASFNILNQASQTNFEKLKLAWEKTPENFDLYFYKNKGTHFSVEKGEVDVSYLQRLGLNIPINPSNITVVFTNNLGIEKVPMTPWIIAHRFAHAIRRSATVGSAYIKMIEIIRNDFSLLFEETFNINKKYNFNFNSYLEKFMISMATMRSAKTNKISRFNELFHEFLAQYLLEGKITYNKEIPNEIILTKAWGRPANYIRTSVEPDDKIHIDELKNRVIYYEDKHSELMEDLIKMCVGRIFVM